MTIQALMNALPDLLKSVGGMVSEFAALKSSHAQHAATLQQLHGRVSQLEKAAGAAPAGAGPAIPQSLAARLAQSRASIQE